MKDLKSAVHWPAAALGASVGMVSMVVAVAAAAGLMAKGRVPLETMGYWAAGILVGSSLLGSLTALGGGGSAADAVLSALGELVVLIGVNAVLNGGEMEGMAVTLLALAGGCGAAVLIRLGKGSGRKRRRRPRKNR